MLIYACALLRTGIIRINWYAVVIDMNLQKKHRPYLELLQKFYFIFAPRNCLLCISVLGVSF
jgi:hypothetical protein